MIYMLCGTPRLYGIARDVGLQGLFSLWTGYWYIHNADYLTATLTSTVKLYWHPVDVEYTVLKHDNYIL